LLPRKSLVAGLAAATMLLGTAGAALAVTDGHYSPDRQHCSPDADESDYPQRVEPGCHSATALAADGNGHEYVNAGTQQQPSSANMPFEGGDVAVDPGNGGPATDQTFGNGQTGSRVNPDSDPASGMHLYFGADDNLDSGEHDSSEYEAAGPSDGGGIEVNAEPASIGTWMANVMSVNIPQLLIAPLPLVSAGAGSCADGICENVTTERRTAFDGGANKSRDVSDYEGKEWDPETCGGPDDQPEDCGGQTLGDWNDKDGATYVEPGVQVFEDGDAEGSPAGPSYPIPAAAVTTCGVFLGGGSLNGQPLAAPESPVTNSAGQVAIKTGCPQK
jgi:hypothetical protein